MSDNQIKELPCRRCGRVWQWYVTKKTIPYCPDGYGCSRVKEDDSADHITELKAGNETHSYYIMEQYQESGMKKEYVIITTISTHRSKFVIPKSELQKMNTDVTLTDDIAIDWAKDNVTMNEANEFSQEWLGELIADVDVKTEGEVLAMFDRENEYLKGWSYNQKMEYIKNWRAK